MMSLSVLLPALLLAAAPGPDAAPGKWMKLALAGKDLWATLKTNQGDIVVHLFSREAPKTVANFVGLAAGEKSWKGPDGQWRKTPAYDKTIFHRVIPEFMIQGGDPANTGRGDVGFTFEDEFQSGRLFDKVGLIAMANQGPNTNAAQFFITCSTPHHLDHHHTIFGEVVSGYDTVVKISRVPAFRDRPKLADMVVDTITLSEKSPKGSKPKHQG